MEPQGVKSKVLVVALVALVIGVGGGYFTGHAQGKKALLAEQTAAVEAEKKAAQEAIAEQANPFAETVNPFEGGYENPFEGAGVNPFQQ